MKRLHGLLAISCLGTTLACSGDDSTTSTSGSGTETSTDTTVTVTNGTMPTGTSASTTTSPTSSTTASATDTTSSSTSDTDTDTTTTATDSDTDGTDTAGTDTAGTDTAGVDCLELNEEECLANDNCFGLMGQEILEEMQGNGYCLGEPQYLYCVSALEACPPATQTVCMGNSVYEAWSLCPLPMGWTACDPPGQVNGDC